jgi:N-acyl-D-aspartate/D-glutamate deacylase
MTYDTVIRNGTVVDGSGGAPYAADVAIADGRIAAVGQVPDKGQREIDADGHVVTPGFVDGHTHFDAQLFWDPMFTSSCYHGVTTVVMGNCGFTLAPARTDARELVVRNLERAEDMSPAALAAGVPWEWETFRDYLTAVDRRPKGLNVAAYVGHSALRTWAMGERAFDGPATDDDIDVMRAELADGMRAGAIGFTTSRINQHETSDDRPVASRLANWDEVCQLVHVLTEAGGGIFEIAPEFEVFSPDPEIRREVYDRMGALAISSRIPMTMGMGAAPPRCYEQLDHFDEVGRRGGTMFGQTHSRGISVMLSFRSKLPFDVLPEWREIRERPLEEQKVLLRDPAVREQLVKAAEHGEYGRAIGAEARKPEYERLFVMRSPLPPHVSVAQIAAERGVSGAEAMIDLALESDFEQFFIQPLGPAEPEHLVRVMKHPRSVMTFSDSGAHVSQIVDCSIQTHLLGHWVRNEQAFTLPEAVRMLTSVPAAAWGFADRGQLKEGYAADVNVFDPETVGPAMPELVNDFPADTKRLRQKATGFKATLVAGETVVQDGETTDARPGRLLRGPATRN